MTSRILPVSIIEAAGLTPEEARAAAAWERRSIEPRNPMERASRKLMKAIAAELEASRPISVGDRVRVVCTTEDFTVHTVHESGKWLWAFDADDQPATLSVGAVERVVDTCERVTP